MAGFTAVAPARAAEHEAKAWLATSAKLNLNRDWALKVEAEGRFGDDLRRYTETQLKTLLSRKVGKDFTAGFGYGHMISNIENAPDTHENRLWQQLVWKPETGSDVTIALRARIEQRFFSTGDDVGWRARNEIKATLPVSESVYVYGSGESFFYLNDTDWGAESGLQRLRSRVGVGFDLTEAASVEAGYINQYEPVSGADKFDHILAVTISLSP